MEKASTPRNRLTRSAAKQVNTPTTKIDQEECLGRNSPDENKQNVRKTRRKYDSKAKTNGDTSNIENDALKTNEDATNENVIDDSELEDLEKSKSSPKLVTQRTPSPTTSRRRSLRTRRSITPGPELESSATKKMKRSISAGKLESLTTPTNRRGRRATSESKDFVFTPSKENVCMLPESNGKYIPLQNSSLRIIGKIDEVNEGEKSSEDEEDTNNDVKRFSNKEEESSDKKEEENTVDESQGNKAIVNKTEVTDLISDKNPCLEVELELSSDKITKIDEEDEGSEILSDNNLKSETEQTLMRTPNISSVIDVSSKEESDSNVKSETVENLTVTSNVSSDVDVSSKEESDSNVKSETVENLTVTSNVSSDVDVSSKEESKLFHENETTTVNETDEQELGSVEKEQCLLPLEIDKPSDINSHLEIIDAPETGSFNEKLAELPSKTNDSDSDLIPNKIEEIINGESCGNVTVNESKEYSDCKSQESTQSCEKAQINTMNTVINDESNSLEIDLVNKNESGESYKFSNIEAQSENDTTTVDEKVDLKGVEEEPLIYIPENVSFTENNDLEQSIDTHSITKNPEFSKIDLNDSSDSEEGIVLDKIKGSVNIKGNNDLEQTSSIDGNIQLPVYTDINNASGQSKTNEPQVTDAEVSVFKYNYQDYNEVSPNAENTESVSYKTKNAENSDQKRMKLVEVDLDDDNLESKINENNTSYFMDTEPSKSQSIHIQNPHTISLGDSVVQCNSPFLQDDNIQEPLEEQSIAMVSVKKTGELHDFNERDVNENSSIKINEKEMNQSTLMLEEDMQHQSENNYENGNFTEDYYEDEELHKSEEDSCDIYKGLSDSGSYDKKREGSISIQSGDSEPSDMHSGSGGSDEYISSVDDEDEEENTEEIVEPVNEFKAVPSDRRTDQSQLPKDGDKPIAKIPDSPITYDKALAMINKNRVKKIDDEEFFDMFTQELNRVSEESGSDSDIAIVDEYLMEPEESAKKNQQQSTNKQVNSKQPPAPPLPNPDHFAGGYNQVHTHHNHPDMNQHGHPIPTQHNHPTMQRMNISQGAMYQQFDQGMHIRGQVMYNQYGPPPGSIQDPRMFNPHVPSDVDFSSASMYNHPAGRVYESFHQNTPLKVRSVLEMNSSQPSSIKHNNYGGSSQVPSNLGLEGNNMPEHFAHHENRTNLIGTSGMAEVDKLDVRKIDDSRKVKPHEFSSEKAGKSKTPILDLLGLEKKELKLLKKALGLDQIKRMIRKQNLEEVQKLQKKCLIKDRKKTDLTQHVKKKRRNRKIMKENKKELESDSSMKSTSEQSSEESSTTSGFTHYKTHYSSSENENREVNIEDERVFVTVNASVKPRHRNKSVYEHYSTLKRSHSSSNETSPGTSKSQKKYKFSTNKSKRNKFSGEKGLKSRKMAEKSKQEQKKSTVLKSKCGTFTVDPLTTSSQSSDSEVQSLDDREQIEDFRRKMKIDLDSGKNKLSNMFAQHSLKKTKGKARWRVDQSSVESEDLRKKKKVLMKLPSEILEALAMEEKGKKRPRGEDSGLDDVLERPKKIRKKSKKIKVKSVASDQNYIPCVTAGATQFGLSRLDKDGTLTLAEKAAKFRTDHLYGSNVKRITSQELLNMKKKRQKNEALSQKRLLAKRSVE